MLYRRFIEFLFYHSQEKEAIKMVNQLITNYPDRLIYPLDMAHIFYSLGQFQSGLQLLDIIEQKDDYYSKCKEALIRAKIMFEMEKDTLGLKYYLDALDSIQDTSDVKLVFNDLRYIMRKNEYQEYSTLMINQMTDFYLRFWRSRDPNLATDLNERIPEHYRRLFYARKYFRRYVGEEPYNRWGSRYKLDDADDFAYQISGRKVLDDMGLIHIRHGEPDIVRDYNVGEIETNYSWKYNETSDSPDKIFHFIFRGTYGYNMDPLPITFRNREDLGPVYGRMVFNQYYRETDVPQGDIEQDTERLEEEANEDMQIGFQTETTDYQYKDVALQFPIQFLNFKDKDGLSLFELYYLVIGEDIESESIGQESQLNLSQFIGIYDMRWDQMIRKSEEKRIPLPYTRENWREHSIVLLDRFKLSPGQYHCEFQIKDLITNKIGLFKDTLSVKDFSGPELMLSDILLSGPIEESNKDNFFKKGKISYSPAMFRAFERGSEVGLYFEIYNQTFDANGMTHTEITWTLRKADTKKGVSGLMKKLFWRDKGTVKTSYQVTGVDRDETVYFNLEQGEMNSGNYEIVIKVMDLNTRQVSEREVMITIK